MAEIVLDNVTKRFPDGSVAVDDVNLDIADGEFIILVGPSGCGKSTTLNMIAGLEDITAGELRIGGQRGQRQGAQGPRHRDGVPVLRALPAHDGAGEHGLPAALAKRRQGRRSTAKVDEAAEMLELTAATSTASRPTCPAGSGSGWRWGGRSSASPRRS